MTYRAAKLSTFSDQQNSTSVARGQNFSVECIKSDGHSSHKIASSHETILVVPETAITLVTADSSIDVPMRSLVILPEGRYEFLCEREGQIFALTTGRLELEHSSTGESVAHEAATLDPRVKPTGEPFQKAAGCEGGVRIYSVDDIPHPLGNARLKFLQSATMSINWVEYQGARDRTKLSPHSHSDFEQGSLAIAGDYIHHLRTPWGPNAEHWRDDQHMEASAGSLLVIPPDIIHTTEGVGDGHSVLVDVFSPPRIDFIAKGWMHNAADYIAPADTGT